MEHLLIIDPQNDFCDSNGSLYVSGAGGDMQRLANYICDNKKRINKITVSLDFHRVRNIALPSFWKDENGKSPAPFTVITKEDILAKKWYPMFYEKALDYVAALEQTSTYNLCIWPEHCLVGSWGAAVYPAVQEAILDWERTYYDVVYVTKGENIFTEHYSILGALVPDGGDSSTVLNKPLLSRILDSERLVVAGEASSHCVANTLYDIVLSSEDSFKDKIMLLKNCMSPVTGFESIQENLFATFNTI